jgi:ATP phosphoribosyltransferase regulatory subunit
MTDYEMKSAAMALLPVGLRDLLPPDAEHEAQMVGRLLKECRRHGYERVKPPLVEFEDRLLAGPAAALSRQTFRIMDPASQRMMGVRSDMTPQVARIAAVRLSNAPRPLRLSYAGQVLRIKGDGVRQERQFGQVGAELIGPDLAEADSEVALLAVSALKAVGVPDISLDLALPTLAPLLMQALALPDAVRLKARTALDHRDAPALRRAVPDHADLLCALIAASGPAPAALERLMALPVPALIHPARQRLAAVIALITAASPTLPLSIDLVERRGFEYQTGVSFTLFSRRAKGELGRGGRYRANQGDGASGQEDATGFTLYADAVLQTLDGPPPSKRVLLPLGYPYGEAARLRAAGWHTVAAMQEVADRQAEAQRLGCGFFLPEGEPVPQPVGPAPQEP